MTREEAKKLMESHQSSKGAVLRYWSYVDKIYDDFENQTCDSCKHNDTKYEGFCKWFDDYRAIATLDGNGCCKWEKK